MNITLKQLRAFTSVAKYQNFTVSAKHLHLSQSALSGLIKELETTLGFALFERSTRHLQLSSMGEQLLPNAQRILNEVTAFESEVVMIKDLKQGEVKIAVSQHFASSIMPKLIAKFRHIHPEIHITLIDCSVESVLERVQNMEVDFGLGAKRSSGDDIVADLLFELPFFVVLPVEHRLASKQAIAWSDLIGEDIITLQGPFTQYLIDELPPDIAQVLQQPAYQVNFLPTALGLTMQGLGLTLCLSYASERVRQQNLVMKPLVNPSIYRKFMLYQRNNRTLSPAMLAFRAFLIGHIDELI